MAIGMSGRRRAVSACLTSSIPSKPSMLFLFVWWLWNSIQPGASLNVSDTTTSSSLSGHRYYATDEPSSRQPIQGSMRQNENQYQYHQFQNNNGQRRRRHLLSAQAPQIGDRAWVQDHDVADGGEYTCKELQFWLHTEKHYSNQETYSQLLALAEAGAAAVANCSGTQSWVLRQVAFGVTPTQTGASKISRALMRYTVPGAKDAIAGADGVAAIAASQCRRTFRKVVIFLSNFSINNNFSHFLHALLRLFCALLDARLLVWDRYRKAFVQPEPYTLWLDDRVRLDAAKMEWLRPLSYRGDIRSSSDTAEEQQQEQQGKGKDKGASSRQQQYQYQQYQYEDSSETPILHLRDVREGAVCAEEVVYGSGCVKLLPPEKWFGYEGCRARYLAPAFGQFMRTYFGAAAIEDLIIYPPSKSTSTSASATSTTATGGNTNNAASSMRVAFAVRDADVLTGRRIISNLQSLQQGLPSILRTPLRIENITFEHMDVPTTVQHMSKLHLFISVHGAGMTNLFFMSPGASVIEITPFPLCTCKSPDFFYGMAGYYQGMSLALGLKHYTYCVPPALHVWYAAESNRQGGGNHRPRTGGVGGVGGRADMVPPASEARDGGVYTISVGAGKKSSVAVTRSAPPGVTASGKCSWKHLHTVDSMEVNVLKFNSILRLVERDFVAAGVLQLSPGGSIITLNPHANG